MKKRTIALAVGAALAAPSAFAQVKSPAGTDWEFYGKFYPEYSHYAGKGATAPGTTGLSTLTGTLAANATIARWEMQVSNTYIGFRGSKNLGGGNKGIWQLEQQVNIDEGNTTTSFANRDSFVGLNGDIWGTFRMGIMDTPYKKAGNIVGFLGVNSGNFVSQSNVLQKVGFGTSSASSFNLRRGNALDFTSPTILGGLQTAVQYSIGNPTESSISPAANRDPRVVSWYVKWEAGPFYASFAQEAHFDLFGGSNNAPAARQNTNDATVNSKDLANQIALVYKLGVHSLEADFVTKRYKEDGVSVNGRFQEYKNTAYLAIWEARWTNSWRTVLQYVKSNAGSCVLLNTACTTDGLDGWQFSAGVAYYLDPAYYIFLMGNKVNNGAAARYNPLPNTQPNPSPGEDITSYAVGLAYNF